MKIRKGLSLAFAASMALSTTALAQAPKPSADTIREADEMTQPRKPSPAKPSAAVTSTPKSQAVTTSSGTYVAIPDKEPIVPATAPKSYPQPITQGPFATRPTPTVSNNSPIPDKEPETQLLIRGGVLALPSGTAIRMTLDRALSTETTKQGDKFTAKVSETVTVNGQVAIPMGASVQGRVIQSSSPRRIAGRPSINLLPEKVVMPDGKSVLINATVVDTGDPDTLDVDEEGRIKGPGHTSREQVEIAAGTGAGAVTGGLIAGPGGSLIGAGIGAASTTGRWLFNHHEMEIPAGTEIILEVSGASALPLTTAMMSE